MRVSNIKTAEQMDTKIKKNDALKEVAKILNLTIAETEEAILKNLYDEGILYGDTEDMGKQLDDISDESGYTLSELFNIAFSESLKQFEVLEFFGNITILGHGDCPDCGNELHKTTDGDSRSEWEIHTCSCGYENMTTPKDIQHLTYYESKL